MRKSRNTFRKNLLAGVAAAALFAAAPNPAGAQESSGGLIAGFYATAEARYLMNGGDPVVDLSVPDAGAFFPVPYDPAGVNTGAVEIEGATAYRVGFGLLGGGALDGWDLSLFYTGLGSGKGNDSVDGSAWFYFDYPWYKYYVYDLTVSGTAEQSYAVADLEAGYDVGLGKPYSLRLFGGLRYIDFSQKIETNEFFYDRVWGDYIGYYGTYSYGDNDRRQEVAFSGFGPRIGMEFAARVGDGGFKLDGMLAVSVLFGDQNVSTTVETTGYWRANSMDTYTSSESHSVMGIEAEFGVAYDLGSALGSGGEIAVGYRIESWQGLGRTYSESDLGETSAREADQFFHGPFLRASVKF